ncbi:hypothetical protein [Methylorubrum extorquens]
MKNSEQWLKLAVKVAQSYGDGTRSQRTDNIDRNMMAKCVKVLLDRRPLSQRQRDSFVESVRLRVGGPYLKREFPQIVVLTARQRQTAINNTGNTLSELLDYFPQAFDIGSPDPGGSGAAKPSIVAGMSPAREQDVRSSFPICAQDAIDLLPTCGERRDKLCGYIDLASVTERNTTERNDTERMAEMDLPSIRRSLGLAPRVPVASPADEVALATPPEHPGSPVGSPVVCELRSAGDGASQLALRERSAAPSAAAASDLAPEHSQVTEWPTSSSTKNQCKYGRTGQADETCYEPIGIGKADRAPLNVASEITPGLDVPNGMQLEVSVWTNNNEVTGEIKISGEAYQVNFSSYSRCEELMSRSHSNGENTINAAWLGRHMWENLGRSYRDRQSHIVGRADHAERFAVSGLYGNRRCEGRPVQRVMVRACWEGDNLAAIEVFNGTEVFRRKMKPFRSSNPKAPAYKHA